MRLPTKINETDRWRMYIFQDHLALSFPNKRLLPFSYSSDKHIVKAISALTLRNHIDLHQF